MPVSSPSPPLVSPHSSFADPLLSSLPKVFWTITACFFPLTLAFGLFSRAYLMRLHKDRVAAAALGQYSFLQGDVQWDAGMFKIYPLVAVLAGVIASWFGVGGGTVKGPLLMHLGILPEVVAATSSAMMVSARSLSISVTLTSLAIADFLPLNFLST